MDSEDYAKQVENEIDDAKPAESFMLALKESFQEIQDDPWYQDFLSRFDVLSEKWANEIERTMLHEIRCGRDCPPFLAVALLINKSFNPPVDSEEPFSMNFQIVISNEESDRNDPIKQKRKACMLNFLTRLDFSVTERNFLSFFSETDYQSNSDPSVKSRTSFFTSGQIEGINLFIHKGLIFSPNEKDVLLTFSFTTEAIVKSVGF